MPEIKTYGDLLEALKAFTPEQLQQTASILIEDDSYSKPVTSIDPIGDDIYVNKDDDEDGGTLETLKEIHGEEFKEEDYELGTKAGRIFLYSFTE